MPIEKIAFDLEQRQLIRRKYNEYIREFEVTLADFLNDEKTLKHFIYTVEVELGSKDFNVGLTTSEAKFFTHLLSLNDYTDSFLNEFRYLLETFK